jgi:hypothetical protein
MSRWRVILNNTEEEFGNAFWIAWSVLAMASLIYIGLWAFRNESVKGISIFLIQLSLFLVGIVFANFKVYKMRSSFQSSSFWFVIGVGLQTFIKILSSIRDSSTPVFSIIAPDLVNNNLFSVTQSELPTFYSYYLNRVTIPVVEEIFFLFGLPFMIISFFDSLAKSDKWSFFENNIFKMVVIVVVSVSVFVLFHIPQSRDINFIIGAVVFRLLAMMTVWGDELFNFFGADVEHGKKGAIAVLPSFVLGLHIGLNWMSTGYTDTIYVMLLNPLGWFTLLFVLGVTLIGISVLLGFMAEGVMKIFGSKR